IMPYTGDGGLEWVAEDKNIEGGFASEAQLYDLDSDPGEQTNLANRHAELVAELHAKAMRIVAETYR
ncbi:MAG: hypothetical protein ACKVJN_12150, partial [Woeseiales bacterium]